MLSFQIWIQTKAGFMVKSLNNSMKSISFNFYWTMMLFSVHWIRLSPRRENAFLVPTIKSFILIQLFAEPVQMEPITTEILINVKWKLTQNVQETKFTTAIQKNANVHLVSHTLMEIHALDVSCHNIGTQKLWNVNLVRGELTILWRIKPVCNAQHKLISYQVFQAAMTNAL